MDPNDTASLVPSGDNMFETQQIILAQIRAARSIVAWDVRAFTGKVMNVYQTKPPIHCGSPSFFNPCIFHTFCQKLRKISIIFCNGRRLLLAKKRSLNPLFSAYTFARKELY